MDEFLAKDDIEDYCFNGLQVEGKDEVKKVVLGVTASLELFEEAVKRNGDLVLVHHGQFWSGKNPAIIDSTKKRIKVLMDNDVSLYGIHLPLDRHKDVGNNAQLIKLLGGEIKDEFSFTNGKNVGWLGEFSTEKNMGEIVSVLNEKLGAKCIVLNNKESVKRFAVLSGGGTFRDFGSAVDEKVDLYITGDRGYYNEADQEEGMNVIFVGHYPSEKLGVKALGDVLKEKFGLEVEFVDFGHLE